jgi:hypothetical protein
VPAAVVPASFQYVGEPNQIGLHVGVGVNERIPNAWLGTKMDDVGKLVLGEERCHAVSIGEIEPGEPKGGMRRQLSQTRLFQGWIVVGIEVVQADDRVPFPQQPVRDMVADETGRAGDEDGRRRHCRNSHLFLRQSAGGSAANSTMRHLPDGAVLNG